MNSCLYYNNIPIVVRIILYYQRPVHNNNNNNITLVVPNNSLTRPSDWKYETTPFHSFHWNYGCQRLIFHDGRPIRHT